jgi:histone deacetylase 6
VGEERGKGFNVNVAWNTGLKVDEYNRMNNVLSDLGNNEYKYACDTLLFDIVKEYQPELIIISCGFDSAMHDFLGWSKVSPLMYNYMTRKLKEICPKVYVV